jgi:dihydrofolate synthase/folylpolyglutamate synthase
MPVRLKGKRSTPRRRTVAPPRRAKTAEPSAPRPATPRRIPRDGGAGSSKTNPSESTQPQQSVGYGKALRFLATLSDYERLRIVRYNSDNFNLDRMRGLLRKIGNPQDQFRSVHVAGTKGKGSTCAMIAAMLEANGYKVGLYTSPHLCDIRERIAINGEMISHADFARLIKTLEPIVLKSKPTPTYFDVLTAAAFKHFAEQKVDIAVIETGLGGRLDSTNVIKPEVTAITSISKDHMAQLGNTLEKIAQEKAGIFKPGVPAVTVMQTAGVEATLKRVADQVGAPLDICGKSIEFSYRFEASRMLGRHNRVCLTTPNSRFEHLAVPLLGEHQAINCGLALAVIDKLKGRGIPIDDQKAMDGLLRTRGIPGRMEMVSLNPRVLVDGAHNAASLDAMMKAVGQHIPYDSLVLIFGCCGDKDVDGMLERISSGADKVIFTRVDNIRSANPDDLAAKYVELYGKMAQVAPRLTDALSIARRAVTKEDLICITGSFYLVGEAKKLFAGVSVPPVDSLPPG